jgi:NAD+ kinase
MAGFAWSVQGVALGEIGCDAMVLSTPTGSTAYNLSAGGPVIAWGLEAISVTFVAPHSLRVRSLVLPRGVEVEIENVSEAGDARVVIDGHLEHRALARGERVTVQIADETARLALLPEVAFLQRYRDTFAT